MKHSNISDKVVEYVLSRNNAELPMLTVENIAKKFTLNRSHLSRTFKNEKHCTIEEFVFKIKIIRAATLLKERKDLTIKNISTLIGFSRPDYFIRIFKRYFGTTPAKYRELLRQSIGVKEKRAPHTG
jgi:two-component system response regulator YesN